MSFDTPYKPPSSRKQPGLSWQELVTELEGEDAGNAFTEAEATATAEEPPLEDVQTIAAKINGLRPAPWLVKTRDLLTKAAYAYDLAREKDTENPAGEVLQKKDRELTSRIEHMDRMLVEKELRQAIPNDELILDRSFAGKDFLEEYRDIVSETERLFLAAQKEPEHIFYHDSGLVYQTNERLLPNLVIHHHVRTAVDLWNTMPRSHRAGANSAFSWPASEKFFLEIKHACADEVGIKETYSTKRDQDGPFRKHFLVEERDDKVFQESLQDGAIQEKLACFIEKRFLATDPEFFVACVINMRDVFPQYETQDDGSKTFSRFYVRLFEQLLENKQQDAVRQLITSLAFLPPSFENTDSLEQAAASMDTDLRKNLFQTFLHKEEIKSLGKDRGFFQEEFSVLSPKEQDTVFQLMKEMLHKPSTKPHDFFRCLKKVGVTPEREQWTIEYFWNEKNRANVVRWIEVFSPEKQVWILQEANDKDLQFLVDFLPHIKNLPSVVAQKLLERGFAQEVMNHQASFGELDARTIQQLENCRMLDTKIQESPSRTVRRMGKELLGELLKNDDPVKAYEKIERIFLRNHIPLVGKLFLAFDILYDEEHLKKFVYSPSLKKASPREANMLIYKDLINIHLDTGNPSLKTYLEDMQAVLPLVEKAETDTELDEQDTARLQEFFRKAAVLHNASTHGKGREAPDKQPTLKAELTAWKASLGVREGQKTHDRLEEMFLRPAGVASIEEALARMDASKKRADTLNRELVASSPEKILLQTGDLLKGVNSKYFLSYLQNGNVAGEFLGYAAKDDSTRLDTDTGKVLAKDLEQGNSGALEMNPAKSYGDIVLVMRPTKELFFEDERSVHDQLRGKTAPYEVFSSPVADHERHFGIRTGAPFTEVRAIMLKNPERRMMLDLKMDLVANGYYVPITDIDGKILFTPEEFDELQARAFSGTEMVKKPFVLEKTSRSEEETHKIEALQVGIVAEREMIDITRKTIEVHIKEALMKAGIPLRTSGELAVGAEILNTGSTARHTSIVGETVDFDMAIRLDETDLRKKEEIVNALNTLMKGTAASQATAQWRRTGVNINGTIADIDITFTNKPEVEGTPSHVAIEQRLASLDRTNQEDADWVRANIVYAKKVLKASGVYKKLDGGLGGLGVENWILQNGGNFAKARETFLAAAIDEAGDVRSFEKASERYIIPDAGVNLIENLDGDANGRSNHRHDNFFYFLQREGTDGYTKMVKALQNAV